MRKIFLILLLLPLASFSQNRIYHFEPEVVEIIGTLEIQTFAGPPNYENISQGDRIEKGWYLRLNEAITVEESKNDVDPNAETEKNVRIMQLAIGNDGIWKKLVIGKKIKAKGHFYHKLTGHHHSRILLWVDEVAAVIE
mgnify:CR=1 FL=1